MNTISCAWFFCQELQTVSFHSWAVYEQDQDLWNINGETKDANEKNNYTLDF